tara:strand:- start:688 stop:2433 length:1746 start_codon:yes stop_codon:yes gene_type:complete
MTKLLQLNKKKIILFFLLSFYFCSNYSYSAEDIWKKKENNNEQKIETSDSEEESSMESPILSENAKKIEIKINEEKVEDFSPTLIGLFDPEENGFTLDMWVMSDGKDVKEVLKKINKMKLSRFSEDLLFKVLFTNSYSPKINLTSEDFLKIKIDWLIQKKRLKDLEDLLLTNPTVGNTSKVVKLLVNEYLSKADIKSACEKAKFVGRDVKNNYLDKFLIYCLINEKRNEEAQLVYDLAKERGLKDNFFDDKINYLLGITDKTNQKIKDDNLLNFFLSHITVNKFDYQPNDKTDKYIWRYLASSNLISTEAIENEEIIVTYEKAAAEESFPNDEIFKIYLQVPFNFNQLMNASEVHKNLPTFKARSLIYQKLMLTNDVNVKIELAFLLKELFEKEKLLNVYQEELSNILKNIDSKDIPDGYAELVEKNIDPNKQNLKKIKFDNDILHRSKIIKHFLNDYEGTSKTTKDFKSVYKKVKRNKKYFISIMDIIVLESLIADGITLPDSLKIDTISSELTVPANLNKLAKDRQVGLVMLKIIEIIGEDKTQNLDPETIYFLTKILNELNLKKIRNKILSETLPLKV